MTTIEKIDKLISEMKVSYEKAKTTLESVDMDFDRARKKLEEEKNGTKGILSYLEDFLKTSISAAKGEDSLFALPLVLVLIIFAWKPIISFLLVLILAPALNIRLKATGPYEKATNKILAVFDVVRLKLFNKNDTESK